MFSDQTPIEYYKKEEFEKIPENHLSDFLPSFYQSAPNLEILETWKTHFKEQNVPYCVAEGKLYKGHNKPQITLWKRDETISTDL